MKKVLIVLAAILVVLGINQANTPAPSLPSPTPQLIPTPSPLTCHVRSGRPDPACTPGALNALVRQDSIAVTICIPGWTRYVRPSVAYTQALKRKQIALYGFADRNLAHYEEDHLIPLELGGAPDDPRNLWPEPRAGSLTAAAKDKVENQLHTAVCTHHLTLAAAQAQILKRYGPWSPP